VEFGYQYKGVDYHTALIESNPVFIVNDMTPSGSLPVTYTNSYAESARGKKYAPFAEIKPVTDHENEEYSWTTNMNQQNNRHGVGTDMSSFECVTTGGKTVVVDNYHADGFGKTANLGNWMIDYHDNMTFVNQSDRARTVVINKAAQGALMAMVIDPEGKVLSTKCTIVPLEEPADERQWKIYEVEIPAHSTVQFCVSYLLMGNSYGDVDHWITVL